MTTVGSSVCSTRLVGVADFSVFYDELLANKLQTDLALQQCFGWTWEWPNRNKGWTFPSKVWATQRTENKFDTDHVIQQKVGTAG